MDKEIIRPRAYNDRAIIADGSRPNRLAGNSATWRLSARRVQSPRFARRTTTLLPGSARSYRPFGIRAARLRTSEPRPAGPWLEEHQPSCAIDSEGPRGPRALGRR